MPPTPDPTPDRHPDGLRPGDAVRVERAAPGTDGAPLLVGDRQISPDLGPMDETVVTVPVPGEPPPDVSGLPLWRRVLAVAEDRTGLGRLVRALATHRVPPGTGWKYVFGSSTLLAFIVQVVTGVSLALTYVPSAEGAYSSLEYIENAMFLGSWVRGLHFYGASAMVVMVTLHLVRVFVTGAFKFPREANWLSGAVLLVLVVLMGFTGQILRWDQNAVWSVVVGAEQAARVPVVGSALAHLLLGGESLGAGTLSRIFALHVFVVPLAIGGFVAVHLFLVFRNGISEPARRGQTVDPRTYRQRYALMIRERGVPFFPDAAWRDAVAWAVMIAVVAGLAWFVGAAAIGGPPDPSVIDADPRPDWYLIWYFALLALLPRGMADVLMAVLPAAIIGSLFVVPFFNRGERHISRRPWALLLVVVSFTSVASLTVLGYQEPWLPSFGTPPLPASATAGVSPLAQEGAVLFRDRGCQYCHAVEGLGGARGPDLTRVGERLNREETTLRILNGGGNMPAFAGVLTTDQIEALVAFLETRRRPGAIRPRPDVEGVGEVRRDSLPSGVPPPTPAAPPVEAGPPLDGPQPAMPSDRPGALSTVPSPPDTVSSDDG